MTIDDLQAVELLDLDPEAGTIRLSEQRMVLQGAGALGLLRRDLVQALGAGAARTLLTRFGYADGYHDAMSLRAIVKWSDPLDGLRLGLRVHAIEGVVQAQEAQLSRDARTGALDARVVWRNSYEAEQHLHHLGAATEPVCWTLVGYLSGFATACLGAAARFRETACTAAGADRCVLAGCVALENATAPGDELRESGLQAEVARLRAASARTLRSARREGKRRRDGETLRDRATRYARRRGFVARSPEMLAALELAMRVAPLDSTVVIAGESGTGKEFFARLIHDESRRAAGPWVPVNCGALAETLLESELFGHVRGAFTGATVDKAGLFEQAARGTLFLDEVSEMTPALQVKLLRALQEREIRRVGGERILRVDVRVVAASNRDLREEVSGGRFRQDLYFRLSGLEIRIPPLRTRREDLPLLAAELMRRAAARCGRPISTISAGAMRLLTRYPWPGNVRELERTMERAVIVTAGPAITAADLPPEIAECAEPVDDASLNLKRHELRLVREAMARFRGNRRRAAEALGISTVSLWRKLKDPGPIA